MPSNRRQREGRLNQSQVDNSRRANRSKVARDYIIGLGAYKGTLPIDLLFYDKKTGRTYNWLDKAISEGLVNPDHVSINGAYPERPIQIILSLPTRKVKPRMRRELKEEQHRKNVQTAVNYLRRFDWVFPDTK